MKIYTKILAAVAFVAAIIPQTASATPATSGHTNQYNGVAQYEKSVVLDTNGNVVTTKDGVCVTHNFEENGVAANCASSAPHIIYFDFGKSGLNGKGKKVVKEIADHVAAKKGDYKVKLTGHADRVSSDAFNQKLSEKRVQTVKDALVKRGVDANKIYTNANGENSNAVATQDGVAEQLNRRVEVEIE